MAFRTAPATITIANNGTTSSWFEMPNWASFCIVYFPAMDNGDIGIEVTIDGGTTSAPILKADGTADFVVCASAVDPGWNDISDYIRALPDEETHDVLIRFTCASQVSGAVTLYAYFKE